MYVSLHTLLICTCPHVHVCVCLCTNVCVCFTNSVNTTSQLMLSHDWWRLAQHEPWRHNTPHHRLKFSQHGHGAQAWNQPCSSLTQYPIFRCLQHIRVLRQERAWRPFFTYWALKYVIELDNQQLVTFLKQKYRVSKTVQVLCVYEQSKTTSP